jgi:hypothetical protein
MGHLTIRIMFGVSATTASFSRWPFGHTIVLTTIRVSGSSIRVRSVYAESSLPVFYLLHRPKFICRG